MFNDIPNFETFTKIDLITKGMASDKKYHVITSDNRQLLLRISDIVEYDQKNTEFEIIKTASELGIPMSQPIDFGICNNGKNVYSLLSWIDGRELEFALPSISKTEQYVCGLKSGRILRKIHAIPAPNDTDDWATRYFRVIDERLDAFRAEGIPFDGCRKTLAFLENNRHLLKGRLQCRHHGDYHEGNMILASSGELSIIDWHCVDFDNYGDPWYEFNRIGVSFPMFASGQIDGYFDNKPPEEFWILLAYYLAASAITSIVWAKYFASERLSAILQLNLDILRWFNNMENFIPTWYKRDILV